MQAVSKVGDWYITERGTYIRIFRATKAPHVLPRFIPDKLALQEVAYPTLVHGVGAALIRDNKAPWPPMPFYVGSYSFKDSKEATAEADILETFHFGKPSILGRKDSSATTHP